MRSTLSFLLIIISVHVHAETQWLTSTDYPYEPSAKYPFGRANPNAPEQIKDFSALIGLSQCQSTARNPDGSWQPPQEIFWRYTFIMNGFGVQDETLKPDGSHSGSIRQYIAEQNQWYVHYYSSGAPTPVLPAWQGNKTENGDIVLYRERKAPNGMDGFYKITFYDISESKFNWLGEWVDKEEKIKYPTWKIECKKTVSG